jgi:nitrous oxide reductase accessory protein NosL
MQKISCKLKLNKMKKIIFSALVMTLVMASCNQKNKETTTNNSHMMGNDSTMMDNDSTMMNNNSKMMAENKYACPMHPENQGKLNDKCPTCGMKLTEPVREKAK